MTLMFYPYPMLIPMLRHRLSVSTYLDAIQPFFDVDMTRLRLDAQWAQTSAYWQQIPSYHYATCPFCQHRYTASLDSYTLWGWNAPAALIETPYERPLLEGSDAIPVPLDMQAWLGRTTIPVPKYQPLSLCPHWLGVHLFLNLHNIVPESAYYRTQTGEVPFITPWLFADDIASMVVLGALPICRIYADRFVPTYTAFWLCYFSMAPQTLLDRHYEREAALYGHDPEFYPCVVAGPGIQYTQPKVYDETRYDLAAWCHTGKLGWLDFTQPDQPLQIGYARTLPTIYTTIHGDRCEYTYRNGVKGYL